MNRPDPQLRSMIPAFPEFALPARRVSAWVVETNPDRAQGWLAALPLADVNNTAQQLYRTLFTLNRMDVEVEDRLALMELIRNPVMVITGRLQSHFSPIALPLRPRIKQLADFVCQLQLEMAYGYKHVLETYRAEDQPWESEVFRFALERSIHCLGESLLRSYQVYMPAPAGVWREIHGLYRFAEQHDVHRMPIEPSDPDSATAQMSYLQVLMLGLCGPYQLLQNECHQVNAFLTQWADKVEILSDLEGVDPVGHFLLDYDADHPAVPFPIDVPMHNAPSLRAVNAIELARVTHQFIKRLQKGESPRQLKLGFECIGTACIETLRRMMRFWGLAGRGRFSGRRLRQPLSLCVGINAIHFFTSGQQPFTPPVARLAIIDLEAQAPDSGSLEAEAREASGNNLPAAVSSDMYRIDSRWQVRDESARGLSLVREGDVGMSMRIGDLLGIHHPVSNRWGIAVVRWIKSGDTRHVESGIEMLAPSAYSVAVRSTDPESSDYLQALMLPPIDALRQPSTLLLHASLFRAGQGIEIVEDGLPPRRVRILKIVERTGSFSQAVFADEAL